MKNLVVYTLLCWFMFFGKLFSQSKKVESGSYNLLLKTLLSHTVPEATVKEATSSKAMYVDARERREYEVSHLQDAQWVGYNQLDLSSLQKVPKNQPIIVYCSVGYRSEKVAEKLLKQGFTNVKNLYGGIFEWKNQGKTVVNDKGPTEDVHAYDRKWGIWLNKGNKVYE